MRICIDFDGVLADTCVAKRAWIKTHLGILPSESSIDRSYIRSIIGASAYEALQANVGYCDTLDARPMTGAIDVLLRVADKVEVHLVSARPPTKMLWLHKWIENYELGGVFQSILSSYGHSKGVIASELGTDFIVDNDERHLVNLPRNIVGVLFGNKTIDEGAGLLEIARDWKDVESIILAKNTQE